jgi:hypothetical protein
MEERQLLRLAVSAAVQFLDLAGQGEPLAGTAFVLAFKEQFVLVRLDLIDVVSETPFQLFQADLFPLQLVDADAVDTAFADE